MEGRSHQITRTPAGLSLRITRTQAGLSLRITRTPEGLSLQITQTQEFVFLAEPLKIQRAPQNIVKHVIAVATVQGLVL